LLFGAWGLGFICYLVLGIWNLIFGSWDLGFICFLVFGIWNLACPYGGLE
jgi:hypothetical protein